LISYHNPKFHEKIMKKYGRIIRKSYFPNLFFKQEFRSPGQRKSQRKIHVLVQIKLAFYNKIVPEDFHFSPKKEKTRGSSKFSLKLKILDLKPSKPVNEKNIFPNFKVGKTEPQNLYRFTFPVFPFRDLRYPESTTSGYLSFNPAPIRLIRREVTGYNLRPSHLRSLNLDISESRYLNFLSINSTLSDLKSVKPRFLGNNSRVLDPEMRSRIQTLQNREHFFLRGSNLSFIQPSLRKSGLFFTQSRLPVSLPVVHEISFEESGFTSPAAYLIHPFLTASSFFRKVYDGTLRKSELKHPGQDIFVGKVVPEMRPSRGIKGFTGTKGSTETKASTGTKGSRDSEIILVPLSRLFDPKSLEYKSETEMKRIKPIQKKQYSDVEQLEKDILEKQQVRATKEKQNFIEIKEKQHNRIDAVLCNYEKNIFITAGFAAKCLTHLLTPVLEESGFPRKIQNESFEKIEQQLPVRDFSRRGDALAKRFGTKTIGLKTYDELLEPLSLLFHIYSLKGKTSKGTVKSLPRRKNSDEERQKLRIWEKQHLIERKVEQRQGKLPVFRKIGNMVILPSVQSLIPNFREKNAYLLDYKSLTYPENPETGQNLTYQQRKVVFPYSKKKSEKLPSAVRRFSAKETTTGKKFPEKFSKSLLIFQSLFLKEVILGFPVLYIQKLTSKPTIRIRNPLLHSGFLSSLSPKSSQPNKNVEPVEHTTSRSFRSNLLSKDLLTRNLFFASNNKTLRTGISGYGATGPSRDHGSNRSISNEMFMLHRRFERNSFAGFTNVFRQYPEITFRAGDESFEKKFYPSIVETNKNLQSVLRLSSYQTHGSKISENMVIRIFNYLTTLINNLVGNRFTVFQQKEQQFQTDRLKIITCGRTASSLNCQPAAKRESTFLTSGYHIGIKPVNRKLSHIFNVRRPLPTGNKPGHTTGTFVTYGTDMTGSQASPAQEKRYHSRFSWIQKTLKLPESLLPFHITAVKDENPAYQQKIPELREPDSLATYTPKQPLIQSLSPTRFRIFKSHMVSKSNLSKKYNFNPLTFHITGNSHKTAHYSAKLANYSAINKKMEHRREKRREQEYSGPNTQIDELRNRLIRPVFLKALNTIVYGFRKPEILVSGRTQNIVSGGTKILILGLREGNIDLRQNNIIQNTSVHTERYPVKWTSNSSTTSKQSYHAFFKYFSVLPRKEILEYSRILYSTSGMNTPATTEQRSIFSEMPNQILANNLISNILLSSMSSTSISALSLSKTIGIASGKTVPVYNLLKSAFPLKSASSIISQYPLFATKFGVPSNTEIKSSNAKNLMYKAALRSKFALRSKPDSISQSSRTQKPDVQKASYWKIARMSLSPEGGENGSANPETLLQSRSLDSLERKNNKLRVNKNIDTFAEVQMGQHLFSYFVHSAKPDFTKGMKRKKIIFTTPKPEKNPEKMQNIFDGLLFRSKLLKSSEKTAGSRIHLGPESTDFVSFRTGEAGKLSEFTVFGSSIKGRSELTHAGRSNQKTGREDLVYGTSEPFLEEVKKIKKIVFETREIVADHLEFHMPQVTGKPEQIMDIEDMAEKIMQVINHRLKIEAERRGIF
jgi:hypothetical protein